MLIQSLLDGIVVDYKWQFKEVWRWNAPLKSRVFLWLALSNWILTWDNFVKRGGIGPGMCLLCRSDTESIAHLFISCPFSREI